MRSLRKTLTALSPAILLVSVLCGIISGQSSLTTIQDTLFDADGARYNGTLTIQWSTFDTTNPGTIIQQSQTVQVVNGNLLVQLAANNTATPPANIYTVLYQSDGDQQYTETWSVPYSANSSYQLLRSDSSMVTIGDNVGEIALSNVSWIAPVGAEPWFAFNGGHAGIPSRSYQPERYQFVMHAMPHYEQCSWHGSSLLAIHVHKCGY